MFHQPLKSYRNKDITRLSVYRSKSLLKYTRKFISKTYTIRGHTLNLLKNALYYRKYGVIWEKRKNIQRDKENLTK